MGKIVGWKWKVVMDEKLDIAYRNGEKLMDKVVNDARSRVRVGKITRTGKWSDTTISFKPNTGRNKGKSVKFDAASWSGRFPGQLRDTIRRRTRRDKGNIRVMAGNRKVIYAEMVERGTVNMPKNPFLRPAFNSVKANAAKFIENGG